MNSEFLPLGEFCKFTKGLSYKGEFLDEPGPCLIGMGSVYEGGGFKQDNLRSYGGPFKTRHSISPGDIFVAMTNMAEEHRRFLGSTSKIPTDSEFSGIITHHVCRVDWITTDLAVQEFLYWIMRSDYFLAHCRAFGTGTTVYAIKGEDAERFLVPKVPSKSQLQIARILTVIEDYRNHLKDHQQTLQSLLHALYQDLFIEFTPISNQMSGSSNTRTNSKISALFPRGFEESEIGLIPEGWRVGTIHDIARQRNEIVRVDEFNDDLAYIGLEHMPRESIALRDWGSSTGLSSNKRRFAKGDILFGKLRPYFHKVGPAPVDGVCSTDILVIQPIDEGMEGFLLPILSSKQFIEFVTGVSEGVGLPRTKWDHFKLYKIPIPPKEIQKEFSSLVNPILGLIEESILQSRNLDNLTKALLAILGAGH